jgi:hypothetical protein
MDIRLARAICQGIIEAQNGIERLVAWQATINDGSVWTLAHSRGYSLGREAQRLINKGYCTDTPRPAKSELKWPFNNHGNDV